MSKQSGVFLRAVSDESREMIIDIVGVIGWEVGYQQLKQILAAVPDGVERVVFDIYSPGGDVWEGNAIVHEIGTMKQETVARVRVAASMATLIAVACKRREMNANGRFLIHNPWTQAIGDAAEFEKRAKELKDAQNEAAAFYANRTGQPVEKVLALMNEERWMVAAEAKEFGFVQDVIDPFAVEEYAAVRQELEAAGKWPQALVEIPPQEEKPDAPSTPGRPAVVPPAATMPPAPAAVPQDERPDYRAGYDNGYAAGSVDQAGKTADAVSKLQSRVGKQDELIREHQSARDKAVAAAERAQQALADAQKKAAADLSAAKQEADRQLAAANDRLSKTAQQHAADCETLRGKLGEACDRIGKLTQGALTFSAATDLSWPEALQACGGDYAVAAGRHPEALRAYRAAYKARQ